MAAVRHLVLLSWAERTTPEQIEEVREVARGLASSIPGIRELEEGPSVSPEGMEGGNDWALSILFEDEAARDVYLTHPAHQVLADLLGARLDDITVFDIAVDAPLS